MMSNEFLLPPDAKARHDMLGKMQASAKQKRETEKSPSGAHSEETANQEAASRCSEKPRE